MKKNEVKSKIQGIFRTVLKKDELELSEGLTANDVVGWDSLSHMLIISEIENAFDIKFKLKDLNKMKNVGNLIDIVTEKL